MLEEDSNYYHINQAQLNNLGGRALLNSLYVLIFIKLISSSVVIKINDVQSINRLLVAVTKL